MTFDIKSSRFRNGSLCPEIDMVFRRYEVLARPRLQNDPERLAEEIFDSDLQSIPVNRKDMTLI